MKDQSVKFSSYRTHHWLFGQFIRAEQGLELLLNLAFPTAQLDVLQPGESELIATQSTAPGGRSQEADAVARVPLKHPAKGGIRSISVLIEMKSRLEFNELIPQVARYQFGEYQKSRTPVVVLTVSNDARSKIDGKIHFSDWLADPGDAFWSVFGQTVMAFEVIVMNLRSKRIQKKLRSSKAAVSLLFYALGNINVGGTFDRQVARAMVTRSLSLSESEIYQFWAPVVQYINERQGLTFSWWMEIEKEITGDSKVIEIAMSNAQINREEGRQEGRQEGRLEGRQEGRLEGRHEGRLEERQTLAQTMLRDGVQNDFIKKYFDFSDAEVESLRNGAINGE